LRRATLQWCGGTAGDLPALRVHCDRAASTCHGGRHLKTERLSRKVYRTREDARAVVFDYIERFYNPLENLRS
jgi:transposase InsO family protein